jgi:hypothetical protein
MLVCETDDDDYDYYYDRGDDRGEVIQMMSYDDVDTVMIMMRMRMMMHIQLDVTCNCRIPRLFLSHQRLQKSTSRRFAIC